MVEFDENLNPIQGGQPSEPVQNSGPLPTQPVEPVQQPEPIREPVTVPTPPTPFVDNFVATPPPIDTKVEPQPIPKVAPMATAMPTDHPPIKQRGGGVVTTLGILAILAATAIAIVSIVSSNNSSFVLSSAQPEGLTVTATGTVHAIPDVAKVTFGITHKAPTVGEVEEKINETFADIENTLDEFDIKDKDIETNNYKVYPEYDYRSKDRPITGYTGSHQQTITIRNLDDVNKIVDAVTDAGANMINNVSFTIDDSDEWDSRARAEAIKKAKAKAKLIADEAGINLGKILSIDQGTSYPQPYYRGIALDAGLGGGGAEEILPDIEPGSQELSATVTLTYEIK